MAVKSEVGWLGAAFTPPDQIGATAPYKFRATPDEGDPFRVPIETEFSTEMPGGHGAGHVVLERPDGWDVFDSQMLLGDCQSFDQAGVIAHKGRVASIPQTGVNEITVELEGWSKHLEDRQDFRQIFVDADQGAWTSPSTDMKEVALQGDWALGEGSWAPSQNDGLPELWEKTEAGTIKPWVMNMYWAPDGVDIGSLFYAWRQVNFVIPDTHLQFDAGLMSDDSSVAVQDSSSNFAGSGPGSGTVTASGTPRRNAWFEWWWNGGAGSWLGTEALIATQLAVYGTHGITQRGSQGATSHKGYYASDMIDWIVDHYAPMVDSRSAAGNVEATTFVVPHAVFRDDMTPRAAIESLCLLGGSSAYPLDWFVFESNLADTELPCFFLKTPGTYGNDWRVRRDQGAIPDFAGLNAQDRPTEVKVKYNDGVREQTVGGTNTGAMTETTDLETSDPNHPGKRLNTPIIHSINVGINSEAGATLVGQVYLAEKNRAEWMGSISQTGQIKDAGGTVRMPYEVRAGDRVIDETDSDTRERTISATTYNSNSRTVSMTIGPRAQRFDLLLARLELAMMPLGVGGTSNPESNPKSATGTSSTQSSGGVIKDPILPNDPIYQSDNSGGTYK